MSDYDPKTFLILAALAVGLFFVALLAGII